MQTMYVKPAKDGKIRFPDEPSRLLSAEGEDVPCSQFWHRRLSDGSVVKSRRPTGKEKNKS